MLICHPLPTKTYLSLRESEGRGSQGTASPVDVAKRRPRMDPVLSEPPCTITTAHTNCKVRLRPLVASLLYRTHLQETVTVRNENFSLLVPLEALVTICPGYVEEQGHRDEPMRFAIISPLDVVLSSLQRVERQIGHFLGSQGTVPC